jgi:hypothetical protein
LSRFGSHAIKEAAQGGFARVATFSDPGDGDADHRSTDHGQIQGRGGVAHAAAVFAGNDIQAQMQARFDAPVTAVGWEHFGGAQGRAGFRGEQVLGFDALHGLLLRVEAAGQPGGLFDEGKGDGRGGGVKGDQATGLSAAPIPFAGLNGGRLELRGKRRATDLGRVVARFWRRLLGCL